MDTPTRIFLYGIIGSTWLVVLVGIVLALFRGTLVIDSGVLSGVLAVVGTFASTLVSMRFGVNIHTRAQTPPGQPTP